MINVNMTDKAGVTLATAGKYCADNVKVTPSADILRKDEQAKTATPTTSVQDITPDAGKALSKVTVNPITAAIVGNLDASSFASAIVSAIEGKGVDVPSGAKLDALAALIENIEAGGGNVYYGEITINTPSTRIDLMCDFKPNCIIIIGPLSSKASENVGLCVHIEKEDGIIYQEKRRYQSTNYLIGTSRTDGSLFGISVLAGNIVFSINQSETSNGHQFGTLTYKVIACII